MQRPRRTSEFQDDPAAVRRLSRLQHKNTPASTPSSGNGVFAACASGTAKKYSTRQSRIAVPLRSSSNERSSMAYLGVPSSSVKLCVSPQKTPLPKASANRVLFSVEKQRAGHQAPVPLHNDKKWVQEKMHHITEHLIKQNNLGGGISTEFLSRGLRQMSIKQFVAIINYFLGYIWGNRFTVGTTNHVEDIINIFQKLHYPHPLNKSWLKTPNTQHSFGNVIVLLDFLMDFVPSKGDEPFNGMYFDLKEPEDLGNSKMNEEHFQIPDLEFQQELLENSEKGFSLWDKQKKEEFDGLKLQTCNLLVQKICGLADLAAVEVEIEKLQEVLKSVQNEKVPENREMIKLKSKLSQELKRLRRDIKALQDQCDSNERDIKELESCKAVIAKEVNAVEIDIKSLQEQLKTQSCSIEQRDQMVADVMQHKQILAIKERTIQDIQNRYHNEQVLHSKAIKKFNDKIENFNALMREIKFSNIMKFDESLKEENLEISLKPKQTDFDNLIPLLEKLHKKALHCVHENKDKIFRLQERCKELTHDIDDKLHPKLNALRTANASNVANLQKRLHKLKENECILLETLQKVEEALVAAEKTIEEIQSNTNNKKSLTEELVQANEYTMQHAEQKHKQHSDQKRSFLKAYDEMLEECIQGDALQRLMDQVQQQEKQLDELNNIFHK